MHTPSAHCHLQQDSVLICRTCPRNRNESGAFGIILAEGIRAALRERGVRVLMVTCLGSCKQPGAVALDSPGKERLRFSGLSAVDIEPLIGAVDVYQAASSGRMDIDKFPTSLRSRLSAVSPKHLATAACAHQSQRDAKIPFLCP
jgi:predicted metal-binding protein